MRARLMTEAGNVTPRDWQLDDQNVVRLGRTKESDLCLRDKHVSRHHAEIYFEQGRWLLRDDPGVTNTTRVNDRRVDGPTLLEDGCAITIGEICLRFHIEDAAEKLATEPECRCVSSALPDSPTNDLALTESNIDSTLEADELSALLYFMNASLSETTSTDVIRLALRVAQHQLKANVAGYLSLDESEALPKLALPELDKVDIHLSRQLTRQAVQQGKTAWLGDTSSTESLSTESLLSYQDAMCVPVHVGDSPLGALHIYRTGAVFKAHQVRFCEALAGCLARCLYLLRSRRALESDLTRLRKHSVADSPELVGDSVPLLQLKQQIRKLAEAPKVLLIQGESGVGKELVALALHRLSSRREGPLVPVNCAALAPTMIDSELFGHVKGAFTGADADRPGLFQLADMGTLFLDEIGELSEDAQAKLLRVLEYGAFRPVGGRLEQRADVRIIAATNRDLKKECLERRFRQDLFFRLGVEIRVPTLRERREDIPALAEHFLQKLEAEYRRKPRLEEAAMTRLQQYHWPGNVRQLRSVLEHAVAMCEGPLVRAGDLNLVVDDELGIPNGVSLNLEDLEKWAVRRALENSGGAVAPAARMLGIHRDTLMQKMKKYEINKDS